MIETTTFPVARCGACARDTLVARELGDDDEWCFVCSRCGTGLDLTEAPAREYVASTLKMMGFDVEGEGPGGCGSGGSCGSCGT